MSIKGKIICGAIVALFLLGISSAKEAKKGPMVLYRIDCGAQKTVKDKNGNRWTPDASSAKKKGWSVDVGGIVDRGDIEITNTNIPEIYRTERYGSMTYRFSVPNGIYRTVLHFAETYNEITETGLRVFDVTICERKVLENFDVFKESGNNNIALVKEFPDITVTNGEISISFIPNIEEPEINGIEIFKQ